MPTRATRRKEQTPKGSRSASEVDSSAAEGRILISDLLPVLEEYLAPEEVKNVYRAYLFSAEAHEGQLRRSGDPYIQHPLSVARILADMRLDSRSLMAAILHDVVEDTDHSPEGLAADFGDDVAHLVDGVTKIGQIEFDSKEHAEAENFRKMLLAMAKDIRVILIKLADRIHNMRTLGHLKKEKRHRISRQTLDIFAPIANRLGMHQWAQELEDLSFRNLYPKRYNAISKELDKRRGNRTKIIERTRDTIADELERKKMKATVFGREKNIFSIYRKMQSRHVPMSEMRDIFAIRVIVDSVDDCYRALGVIHNLYKPVPEKFKDYIAIPKANGYQSLHTLLFGTFGQSVEVQIRTTEMHRIAETGVASHWRYKTDKTGEAPQQLARRWLVDLLETQQQAGNPTEFLEHLKTDLFPDEVYVFTPKGDIKKLPKGATALDFAFAVHSDIGKQCVAARVDHQLVPLHHVLRNGNHVEVVTSRSARPTPLWLNYVVTGKARAEIRSYLKSQREMDSVKLGKQLLDRTLKSIGHTTRLRTEQKIHLLRQLGKEDWNELLADLGTGKRLPMVVARQLLPLNAEELQSVPKDPLPIRGVEGMIITYARCCRPIPGDPITGVFSKGRGIVIHLASCPNFVEHGKHPENWLNVEWAAEVKGEFSVDIRLDTVNKPGVLAKLAAIIAEQQSNINNVSVVARDGRNSTIRFTIEVTDRVHLAQIMRKLRAQKSVIRLSRMKG